MGVRMALVIGIDSYSGDYAPLDCCVHDATQMAGLLAEDEYGFQVTTLLDEQAETGAIFQWISAARATRPEMLLVYFSGHGVNTELGAFIVTADNRPYSEGIEIQKLVDYLSGDAEERHDALIFLDCCHSGAHVDLDRSRPLRNDDLKVTMTSERALALLAASLSSQVAWEKRNHGHGVFTHYLIQALYGDAADHEGLVTVNSIYEVISRNMGQLPGVGETQKPVFRSYIPGRLILAHGMAPSLAPPVPEQELRQQATEARQLLDSFSQFRLRFDAEQWRETGYEASCRRLESIFQWFEKRAAQPGMSDIIEFRQVRETLNRFRTELGLAETGMQIREGALAQQIGAGGFGTVWQVTDDTGGSVAYKIYHAQEMGDAAKVKRFTNGYEAMRLLNHPNIVKVHRFSTCPVGFVMDFVDGSNLRDIDPRLSLDGPEQIKILIDIAEAVKHAHDHDVIHRDIKPENIVCKMSPDARLEPYLTDFDLAWFSTRTQTATKHALGVIAYAAPEQYSAFDAKASNAKRPSLDVFSFGQLVYFCFLGADPDPVNLSRNLEVLQKEAANIGSNEFVRQVGALYKATTEWNPARRIQSLLEVIRRLVRILEELEQTDTDVKLDEEAYVAELIYQLTRDPREPGEPSFTSRSGNWIIYITWHQKVYRKETHPALTIEFVPQGKIRLENVSNEQMRKVLNDRVTAKLRHHKPFANLRKGTHGTYQLFVDYGPVDLRRSGIESVAEAIRSTLEALDG